MDGQVEMKHISTSMIQAAQNCDPDAVRQIFNYFSPFIRRQCFMNYEDTQGNLHSHIDEDLRYQAEIGLYSAIFKFQFREPPENFVMQVEAV